MKVTGAKLANGLLTIELQREIPEEKKPRAIEIKAEASQAGSDALTRQCNDAACSQAAPWEEGAAGNRDAFFFAYLAACLPVS